MGYGWRRRPYQPPAPPADSFAAHRSVVRDGVTLA
jgi:hypothetical protein